MKFRDTPLLPWAIGLVLGSSAALAFRHSPSAALLAIGMATALAAPPSARRWVLPAFVGLAWATVRLDVAVERDADAPAHPIVATVVVLGHVEGAADAPRVVVGLRSIARYGRPSTVRPLRGIAWLSLPAADFDAIPGAGAPLLARPAPGAVLRLRGWAGRPRPPANPLSLPAPPLVLRIGSWRLVDVVAEAPAAGRWASALRSGLERRLEAAVEAPRTSSLVRALLLGDRSRLPKRWSRTVDGWGATHLLAVSGLHIGLAALLVGLTLAPLPPTWHALRPVAMAAAIGLYCLLVGPKPSVLRAGAMASAALAAHSLRRASAGVDLLILAVVGLLAWRPAMVGELGFRLSVLATSAILIATEPLACRLSALPQALRRPAAASIAAQLATTPLLVPLDGGIHLWAPMLDLAAVPWLIVALSLAFGWALAGDSMLGRSCWRGLDVCGSALDALAGLPANWPRRLTVEPSLAVGLLAAIVICLAFVGSPRLRLALLAAALLLFGGPPPSVPPSLVLLDVGQGEAILIRDGRRALLVDGGGWRRGDIAARVVAPALAELGVARLDAMVLTHPDLDHCDGLVGLLEQVPVAE
ncbi:MAG: ComEC/Rec2 family competence protein, partial [Acidobacteriota bacterium]